jgi:hypothetical protein
MKKMFLFLIVSLMLIEYSFAGEWYQGGTLHGSTLSEWYKASYKNRLATCSDWIVGLVDKKQHGTLFKNNMSVLKSLSKQMENCVTDGNKANGEILLPTMKSAESALVCWMLIQSNN